MSPHAPRSAAQHGLFETLDEDEITQFLRTTYIDNTISFNAVHGQPRWRAATATMPQVAGDQIRSTMDYTGTVDPFDYYLFFICRHGRMRFDHIGGEQRLEPGDASFWMTGKPFDYSVEDFGFQGLRLPPGRLEQIAEELTDVPAAMVHFGSGAPVSDRAHRRWVETFQLISRSLYSRAIPLTPLIAEEMARLLVAVALETFPNSSMDRHMESGPGRVAPAAIRRAVAYIEQHAHQHVALADIAAAAGTGTRALQHGFRRHLQTTPLGYLQTVRLSRAHEELRAGDPTRGDTVTAIAARWGFADPSRFAARYRAQFSVTPGHTLRR